MAEDVRSWGPPANPYPPDTGGGLWIRMAVVDAIRLQRRGTMEKVYGRLESLDISNNKLFKLHARHLLLKSGGNT